MNLKSAFRNDDRAVSPVIGVILMVAITVILAAVIGTFVLGLGDSLGDNQPSASIGVSTSADNITLEHQGGDRVEAGNLRLIVEDESGTHTLNQNNEFNSTFTVGDSEDIGYTDGGDPTDVRVRLIHTPSDSILFDRTVTVDLDGGFTFSSAEN